ncbi:probable beta-1,3-galactosyltransferase 14 isoform X2 [Magnolia sinica]|uniref:probable beta-1,3-galactosyltransferase 14 isoform X2 n=1 Tax=Magnolia sinica TaxID=86752 RepID=UPI002657CBE4|nr:probable beta-1,3-galactosyltransferase 14 isoform X2 [Magnolia sinica]
MPTSPKFFYPRQPWLSQIRKPAVSICCFVFGVAGFFFGLIAISRPIRGYRCRDLEPRSVSVAWEIGNGHLPGQPLGNDPVFVNGPKRHKVMGFVGIQTGFGSTGRRRSLRKTWMPSDQEGLQRLEEATGLAFRFVIGRTSDQSKMSELRKEVAEYDDFMLLDIEEEYSNLPHKTLAFFKAAYRLFDSEFYVKADDDIYLRPDRLSLLLAKERSHPLTYLGCMKKGPVFTDPKLKCFRMFSNEDVTIGSWMLAMNVDHEDNRALCAPDCSESSIAVWDIPACSGLCNPEEKLVTLHQRDICSSNPTLVSNG